MVNKIKLFKAIFFAIAGNGVFYFGSSDVRTDLKNPDPNSILSDDSSGPSNDDDSSIFNPTEFNNSEFTMMMTVKFLKKRALKKFLEENSTLNSIGIKRDGQYCVFDNEDKDIICKIDKNDNTIYGRYDSNSSEWDKLSLKPRILRMCGLDEKPFYRKRFELISDSTQKSFSEYLGKDSDAVQFTVMRISRFLRKKPLKESLTYFFENDSLDPIGIKKGKYCVFDNEDKDIIYKIDKNDNTIYRRYNNQWEKLDLNEKLFRRPFFYALTRSLPAQ